MRERKIVKQYYLHRSLHPLSEHVAISFSTRLITFIFSHQNKPNTRNTKPNNKQNETYKVFKPESQTLDLTIIWHDLFF